MLATWVKKNPPMGIASAFSGGHVSVIRLQWYMVEIFSLMHVSYITFSWEQERILPVCYILFQKETFWWKRAIVSFQFQNGLHLKLLDWKYKQKKKIHPTTYSEWWCRLIFCLFFSKRFCLQVYSAYI